MVLSETISGLCRLEVFADSYILENGICDIGARRIEIRHTGFNSLSIYVTADNLAILSARKGYNPMTSFAGSSDTYQYSPLSTIMGGIKFQF